MTNPLATIEGCPVTWDGSTVRFRARARIDVDGCGSFHGDPYAQPDTSLHHNGKALNADIDWYAVTPPQVVRGVAPVVLGCQAWVSYKGKRRPAVVGDVGPRKRIGEISRALAIELGINPSPISGGVDDPEVIYEFIPGQPAVANGVQYKLQPSA